MHIESILITITAKPYFDGTHMRVPATRNTYTKHSKTPEEQNFEVIVSSLDLDALKPTCRLMIEGFWCNGAFNQVAA